MGGQKTPGEDPLDYWSKSQLLVIEAFENGADREAATVMFLEFLWNKNFSPTSFNYVGFERLLKHLGDEPDDLLCVSHSYFFKSFRGIDLLLAVEPPVEQPEGLSDPYSFLKPTKAFVEELLEKGVPASLKALIHESLRPHAVKFVDAMYTKWKNYCDIVQMPAGRGRPKRLTVSSMYFVRTLLDVPPSKFGYPDHHWTVALLANCLFEEQNVLASDSTIRRALHVLGYYWDGECFKRLDKFASTAVGDYFRRLFYYEI